jgi:hypothetical protein
MTYKTTDEEGNLIEFTFEGQEDEVLRLYYRITDRNPQLQQQVETTKPTPRIRVDMPRDQEVEAFIKSKPGYEHDLHLVQNEFFGRTFSSRGADAPMYHRTNRQLTQIRRKIENEEKRKFETEVIDRNFKRYRMVKLFKI